MAKEHNKNVQKAIKKARENPIAAPKRFFQSIKSKRGEEIPLKYIQSDNGNLIIGEGIKEEIRKQTQVKFNSNKQEYQFNKLWFTKNLTHIKEKVETLGKNLTKKISKEEIIQTFKKFKDNKTVPDNFSAEIFKCIDKKGIKCFEKLLNKCIEVGNIPEKWKEAELIYI